MYITMIEACYYNHESNYLHKAHITSIVRDLWGRGCDDGAHLPWN